MHKLFGLTTVFSAIYVSISFIGKYTLNKTDTKIYTFMNLQKYILLKIWRVEHMDVAFVKPDIIKLFNIFKRKCILHLCHKNIACSGLFCTNIKFMHKFSHINKKILLLKVFNFIRQNYRFKYN